MMRRRALALLCAISCALDLLHGVGGAGASGSGSGTTAPSKAPSRAAAAGNSSGNATAGPATNGTSKDAPSTGMIPAMANLSDFNLSGACLVGHLHRYDGDKISGTVLSLASNKKSERLLLDGIWLLFAIVLCGWGQHVLKPLVFLAGFFLAGWVALGILVAGVELLSLELAPSTACDTLTATFLAGGLLGGMLAMCVIKITLFVVGAISGAVVGYGLYIVVLSRFSTDTDIGGKDSMFWISTAALGLVCGLVAIKTEKKLIIVATSLLGGFCFVLAVDDAVGAFRGKPAHLAPSTDNMEKLQGPGIDGVVAKLEMGAALLIAVLSACYQHRQPKPKADKEASPPVKAARKAKAKPRQEANPASLSNFYDASSRP